MEINTWRSHVPLPHFLNTLVQVMSGEAVMEGKRVSQEQLEELLPHLCLCLPSCSITCADLLHTMPHDSSVWEKLDSALINKESLHHEVTSVLYLRHPPALEREIVRVLDQYVGVECQDPWWQDERLDITHFKPHDRLLCANPPPERGHTTHALQGDAHKVNLWADSPLVEASAHNTQLFTRCLELLGNVLWKTSFSFPAIIASRDYLAQVSEEMDEELYQSFPSVLSHLTYLLTLPLATHQDQGHLRKSSVLSVVKKLLQEELAEGGEAARVKVCVMLCFFPFWLPTLKK